MAAPLVVASAVAAMVEGVRGWAAREAGLGAAAMGRAAMAVVARARAATRAQGRAVAVLGMEAGLAAGCSVAEVAPEASLWARQEGSWAPGGAARAAGGRGAMATAAVVAATVVVVVAVAATVAAKAGAVTDLPEGAKVAERRRFRSSPIRP